MREYNAKFYDTYAVESSESAAVCVPHLLSLVSVGSVVDVGCGIGTWLAEFRKQGVTSIHGIDGFHIDTTRLRIPTRNFAQHDLRNIVSAQQISKARFDLAMSLEVAEHLEESYSRKFIELLTSLAPLVLFSAAIPEQGGTHHVNEQWQSYWAKLFEERGFVTADCMRPYLWTQTRVAYYYAQNMMLFVEQSRLASCAAIKPFVVPVTRYLDRVHPAKWIAANSGRQSLRRIMLTVPKQKVDSLLRRMRRAVS